jgi:hypothetical protein
MEFPFAPRCSKELLSITGHVHELKIVDREKKKLPLHVSHEELVTNHLHCLAEKSPKHLSHPESNYTGYEHWSMRYLVQHDYIINNYLLVYLVQHDYLLCKKSWSYIAIPTKKQ